MAVIPVILYTFIAGLEAAVVGWTIMVLSFLLAQLLYPEKELYNAESTTAPRPQIPIQFFFEKIVLPS